MQHDDSTQTVSRLSTVIDSVPTAIVMVNNQGNIVLVNTQTETLFRYNRSQLISEPVELLIPHRFRLHHPDLRQGFFDDPSARPMGSGRDLYGMRRDGTEFPIEIGLSPIRTESGLFVVSAIVDITERKRLEARFRATVESAPTAMVMIDPAGTIVLVNSETSQLFGYREDELINQKVETLVPTHLRDRHPKLRTRYFASPESRRMGGGRDLYGLRKDGTEFPVEIGLNPVRSDEGQFVLAAVVDLTERKRTEEQLRKANEALELSNLELQQFAYIASHDLQTPLRSVSGFAQCLQTDFRDKLGASGNEYIDRIVSSTQRMQSLINDLLSFSRIESRARPFSAVDLNEAYEDALAMLDASIQDAEATITKDNLPTVAGDRSQITQLLLNIIGNGLKYHHIERAAEVSVRSEKTDKGWLVSISDNGIGFDQKYADQIFEIFRRLHNHSAYPGTGIGLAVCRRIVHRHGGRIWVKSEPGSGSTFYFTLNESLQNLRQPGPDHA